MSPFPPVCLVINHVFFVSAGSVAEETLVSMVPTRVGFYPMDK